MKSFFMVLIVALAASCASANMQQQSPRGIVDSILGAIGFDQILGTIQQVGSGVYSTLLTLATQAFLAGQSMWQQALPVFNNLVAELTAHTGNAVQIVSQAVQQLTAVLASGPARSARAGVLDSFYQLFGLNQIFAQIQNVGTGLYNSFVQVATQLLFAGQQMWAQAQPVFNNLIAELTAHTGNAVQLVSQAVQQLTAVLASGPVRSYERFDFINTLASMFNLTGVISTIQSVGSNLSTTFFGILTQLMFAGQQMWAQAQPVFNNLVAELTSHAGNAVQIVSQAVQQLTAVLASGPQNRGIGEFVMNTLGFGPIMASLQQVGTGLYSTFLSLTTQLFLAGSQMWQQALPVFNNLVAELTAHTGNAVQLVSQAVLQLTAVLASGPAY